MNTKLKGSALVAAVGMVFALGVTAPATAATADRPQNVVVTSSYDSATVSFVIPTGTVAIDLVYKTYTNGGGSTATPVSFGSSSDSITLITGMAVPRVAFRAATISSSA